MPEPLLTNPSQSVPIHKADRGLDSSGQGRLKSSPIFIRGWILTEALHPVDHHPPLKDRTVGNKESWGEHMEKGKGGFPSVPLSQGL